MAFSINTVTIHGNLCREPELRSLGDGTAVCGLRIAHNARRKVAGEWADVPQYFDVNVWRGQGEWLAHNLHKGDGIVVQGRLQWREWQTQEGSKRQAVDIVADSVVPVPRGGGSGESSGGGQQRQAAPVGGGGGDGFERALPGADQDIPFKWRLASWDDRYHANR